MKINNLYPKNEKDKILRKVEKQVNEQYPKARIKRFKLTKTQIIVKLQYGQIIFQKSDFK